MTTLKPYPVYKNSGSGWMAQVPKHWNVTKLGRVTRVYGGGFVPQSSTAGDVPVYGANGIIGSSDRSYISRPQAVVGRVGSAGAVNFVMAPAWGTDKALILDNDPSLSTTRYLYRVLRHMDLASLASQNAQPLITGGGLKQQKIPLPPLDEQRAIADFLDGMDARITRFIAARRKMIALLEEKKQAVINQAVTRGLDPSVPMKDSG